MAKYFTLLLSFFLIICLCESNRLKRDAVAELSKHPFVQAIFASLPEEAKVELKKIADDSSLSLEQKLSKVHDILNALPADVKERIPIPPSIKALPEPIQQKIVQVVKDGSLSFAQKRAKLDELYDSLTEEEKKSVPMWTALREEFGL